MFGERNHGQGHPFDHRRPVFHHPLRPAAGIRPESFAGFQSGSHAGFTNLKHLFIIVAIILLAWTLAGRLATPSSRTTSAPSIEQLKPLASLMTHRVVVVDALTVTITGHTGNLKAAVIVRGDAMLSVDLSQARMEAIDHEARNAVIVLPLPHVVSARVDHEHTRIFSIEASGLWALVPSDDGRAEIIARAMAQAQQVIAKAASESAVMAQAKARAESLICSFFRDSLQWSVTVHWADELGAR